MKRSHKRKSRRRSRRTRKRRGAGSSANAMKMFNKRMTEVDKAIKKG